MAKEQGDLHGSHFALARRGVSRTLRSTTFLMLLAAFVLYLLMWWSALRMHMVPSSWGNHGGGNHGPWRHTNLYSGLQNLRGLWHQVLWAFCCADLCAVLSLAAAPSWKRVHLLVLSLALGALYFYTHSWLVD